MGSVVPKIRRIRRTLSTWTKNVLAEGTYRTGVYRALGTHYAGTGVIIMLHRVCEDDRPILYPGYMVPVSAVRRLLRTVRDAGWDIVTLDEVRRRLEAGESGRRFACFTFDDGYADNFTLALPLFREFAAPFAVYVAAGFLDRSVEYWWGALEELVLRSQTIRVPGAGPAAGRVLPAATLEEKRIAYDTLDDLGHQPEGRLFDMLGPALRDAGIDARALLDRDALSIDQLRALAADPLVAIGAHTVSHRRLSTLAPDDAWQEISRCREILQGALQRDVAHFAYPFGGANSCGPREFEMAQRAGYKTAVTTRRGNIFPEHAAHLMCLPRRNVPATRRHAWNALYGLETLRRREPRFRTA